MPATTLRASPARHAGPPPHVTAPHALIYGLLTSYIICYRRFAAIYVMFVCSSRRHATPMKDGYILSLSLLIRTIHAIVLHYRYYVGILCHIKRFTFNFHYVAAFTNICCLPLYYHECHQHCHTPRYIEYAVVLPPTLPILMPRLPLLTITLLTYMWLFITLMSHTAFRSCQR